MLSAYTIKIISAADRIITRMDDAGETGPSAPKALPIWVGSHNFPPLRTTKLHGFRDSE
jgi:hypothetical protein